MLQVLTLRMGCNYVVEWVVWTYTRKSRGLYREAHRKVRWNENQDVDSLHNTPATLHLCKHWSSSYLDHKQVYLFFSSWAGGIQQIQQSDWFQERAEFSNTDRYSMRNPSSWSIFVHELAVIINISTFSHFHRRLINASLSLFTVRWQGKLL